MNRLDKIAKSIILPAGFGTAILGAYWYFSTRIDQDSSLVQQSLDNIQSSAAATEIVGHKCNPLGKVLGEMNQRKGLANIQFKIQCSKGNFLVDVLAHRERLDWKTDSLNISRGEKSLLELR